MKKKEAALSNTKIAIVFFVLLTLIIGISLICKVIAVIKAGQFDDSKRFTLTLDNGRNIEVMSLSPSSKDIVIFKLNDGTPPAEAGRLLEIPIEGFISSDSLDLSQKTNSFFINAIFNYNRLKTNLTIVDLFKLAILSKIIPENSVNIRTVGDASGLALDNVVNHLVTDPLIEKDNQTIQIINATAVGGLGNRLAKLITNMGGDVIIVATENNLRQKSVISYIDKKTYTVERLRKVLGYEAVRGVDNAISDITIIIGKDKINSLPF